MRNVIRAALFAAIPTLATSAPQAAEKAHEHGIGVLNLAVEGKEVEIEMTVPGADAVGFEHAPSNDKDRRAVESAIAKMKAADKLFMFPAAAGCRLEEAEVHAAQLEDDHKDDEHKHDHKDDHKHDKDHDHKDEHKEEHAEFRSHYHFECLVPEKLTHIDVGFFKVFPSAHELEARFITPRGQGAAELTAAASRLKF